MDGIVALLLSKKFTKDTVIGMGAIKGAPCQVQSINKVNKTTTITLKWEDNVGGSHTQAFDIEDGADGVSVTNANINTNGNLVITLSNGNDIDCGKVLPQYDTLPFATSSNVGQILQYIGATNANYTHGYYYECVNDGGVYKWQYINVQDSYTKEQIGSLSDLPDITKNVILNIADLNSAIDDKEDIFRYSSLPSPTSTNVGEIAQYIGTTTVNYINGYYYQCIESPVGSGTYIWVQKNVQPNNGGGGGDGVVDGYYNSTDQLFYEDSAFLNPITGEDNTIYVDLNTNGLYRYDGAIFIKVSSSAESIQVDTMPTASAEKLDKIYQFIGTTGTYTNGYFYKCVYDSQTTTYDWEEVRTQDSYLKNETYSQDEIGDLTNLPDNTQDIVENIIDLNENKENIFRYAHGADIPTASSSNVGTIIQYIGTTTSNYNSGFFYQSQLDSETSTYKWVNIEVQPASGTSAVESVNNKTGVVVLDAKDIGLQVETMPTPNVDNLGDIVQYVGTTTENYTNGRFYKCVYDGVSTYSWVVAEDYISKSGTVGLVKNDGSIDQSQYAKEADLAQEFSTATNYVIGDYVTYLGNLYKFTSNHNAGAWDANDVTSVDVITLLGNKADKVNPATNGDLAGLDANGNLTDSNIAATNVVVKSNTVGLIKNDGDIDTNTYATTTQLNDKADKVTSATANDFATLDASGNLTDSGISKDIVPSGASNNNKLVTANDISTLSDKANKVTSATNGDIATLDSNGDLTDSGFSKDIIPSTATTSNKLATNTDLPTELNDLSDDVVITNPQNNQIFAYNSTSGKWENKTGQETVGGLVFKGSILFANLPTTGMTNGDAYDIKDAFTTDSRFEEGVGIECGAGTDIVWVADENKWNILTPSGVYSFNGRTGAVTPATSDYDADQIDYDNTTSGLNATDVQDGIDELSSEKADKVASATNGHLAGLDGNGNLTDSGVVASNVIQKVTTATGLLKDDGTVDTTNYAPSNKAYLTDDTAETTIDNADYFPFYDSSATNKKKTLWSNIKSVLKTYFDTLYTTIVSSPTQGNLVSLTNTGNIQDSGKKASDFIEKNISATQNDIAIFDANGGITDSNVLISSLPTISPVPSSSVTESGVVTAINGAINTNSNAPSLYGIQKWSNEKKVRRVMTGGTAIGSATIGSTGIGTWSDSATPTETDWWYDAAFIIPDNSNDIELSLKFDPSSGEPVILGGYILDTTTGKLCIKFANALANPNNAKIAVDIIYTRNEVS